MRGVTTAVAVKLQFGKADRTGMRALQLEYSSTVVELPLEFVLPSGLLDEKATIILLIVLDDGSTQR